MNDVSERFFKVNYSIWEDIHFLALKPAIKLLYVALCSFKGGIKSDYPGKCFPSLNKLSEVTGIARSKISEYIIYLVSGGYILKHKERRGKKNICIYTILEKPKDPTFAFFEFQRLDENMKKKKALTMQKARQAKKKKDDSPSIIKTVKKVDSLQNREDSQSIGKTETRRINITINSSEEEKLSNTNKAAMKKKEVVDYWIPTKDDLF